MVPVWVTFAGMNFGIFPTEVTIRYSGGNSVFACGLSAVYLNGPVGSVTNSRIVCRTQTREPVGRYSMQVEVAGQVSDRGIDLLVFPEIPLLDSVSGCLSRTGQVGTFECPTTWVRGMNDL
jgi:hypothetical protein